MHTCQSLCMKFVLYISPSPSLLHLYFVLMLAYTASLCECIVGCTMIKHLCHVGEKKFTQKNNVNTSINHQYYDHTLIVCR